MRYFVNGPDVYRAEYCNKYSNIYENPIKNVYFIECKLSKYYTNNTILDAEKCSFEYTVTFSVTRSNEIIPETANQMNTIAKPALRLKKHKFTNLDICETLQSFEEHSEKPEVADEFTDCISNSISGCFPRISLMNVCKDSLNKGRSKKPVKKKTKAVTQGSEGEPSITVSVDVITEPKTTVNKIKTQKKRKTSKVLQKGVNETIETSKDKEEPIETASRPQTPNSVVSDSGDQLEKPIAEDTEQKKAKAKKKKKLYKQSKNERTTEHEGSDINEHKGLVQQASVKKKRTTKVKNIKKIKNESREEKAHETVNMESGDNKEADTSISPPHDLVQLKLSEIIEEAMDVLADEANGNDSHNQSNAILKGDKPIKDGCSNDNNMPTKSNISLNSYKKNTGGFSDENNNTANRSNISLNSGRKIKDVSANNDNVSNKSNSSLNSLRKTKDVSAYNDNVSNKSNSSLNSLRKTKDVSAYNDNVSNKSNSSLNSGKKTMDSVAFKHKNTLDKSNINLNSNKIVTDAFTVKCSIRPNSLNSSKTFKDMVSDNDYPLDKTDISLNSCKTLKDDPSDYGSALDHAVDSSKTIKDEVSDYGSALDQTNSIHSGNMFKDEYNNMPDKSSISLNSSKTIKDEFASKSKCNRSNISLMSNKGIKVAHAISSRTSNKSNISLNSDKHIKDLYTFKYNNKFNKSNISVFNDNGISDVCAINTANKSDISLNSGIKLKDVSSLTNNTLDESNNLNSCQQIRDVLVDDNTASNTSNIRPKSNKTSKDISADDYNYKGLNTKKTINNELEGNDSNTTHDQTPASKSNSKKIEENKAESSQKNSNHNKNNLKSNTLKSKSDKPSKDVSADDYNNKLDDEGLNTRNTINNELEGNDINTAHDQTPAGKSNSKKIEETKAASSQQNSNHNKNILNKSNGLKSKSDKANKDVCADFYNNKLGDKALNTSKTINNEQVGKTTHDQTPAVKSNSSKNIEKKKSASSQQNSNRNKNNLKSNSLKSRKQGESLKPKKHYLKKKSPPIKNAKKPDNLVISIKEYSSNELLSNDFTAELLFNAKAEPGEEAINKINDDVRKEVDCEATEAEGLISNDSPTIDSSDFKCKIEKQSTELNDQTSEIDGKTITENADVIKEDNMAVKSTFTIEKLLTPKKKFYYKKQNNTTITSSKKESKSKESKSKESDDINMDIFYYEDGKHIKQNNNTIKSDMYIDISTIKPKHTNGKNIKPYDANYKAAKKEMIIDISSVEPSNDDFICKEPLRDYMALAKELNTLHCETLAKQVRNNKRKEFNKISSSNSCLKEVSEVQKNKPKINNSPNKIKGIIKLKGYVPPKPIIEPEPKFTKDSFFEFNIPITYNIVDDEDPFKKKRRRVKTKKEPVEPPDPKASPPPDPDADVCIDKDFLDQLMKKKLSLSDLAVLAPHGNFTSENIMRALREANVDIYDINEFIDVLKIPEEGVEMETSDFFGFVLNKPKSRKTTIVKSGESLKSGKSHSSVDSNPENNKTRRAKTAKINSCAGPQATLNSAVMDVIEEAEVTATEAVAKKDDKRFLVGVIKRKSEEGNDRITETSSLLNRSKSVLKKKKSKNSGIRSETKKTRGKESSPSVNRLDQDKKLKVVTNNDIVLRKHAATDLEAHSSESTTTESSRGRKSRKRVKSSLVVKSDKNKSPKTANNSNDDTLPKRFTAEQSVGITDESSRDGKNTERENVTTVPEREQCTNLETSSNNGNASSNEFTTDSQSQQTVVNSVTSSENCEICSLSKQLQNTLIRTFDNHSVSTDNIHDSLDDGEILHDKLSIDENIFPLGHCLSTSTPLVSEQDKHKSINSGNMAKLTKAAEMHKNNDIRNPNVNEGIIVENKLDMLEGDFVPSPISRPDNNQVFEGSNLNTVNKLVSESKGGTEAGSSYKDHINLHNIKIQWDLQNSICLVQYTSRPKMGGDLFERLSEKDSSDVLEGNKLEKLTAFGENDFSLTIDKKGRLASGDKNSQNNRNSNKDISLVQSITMLKQYYEKNTSVNKIASDRCESNTRLIPGHNYKSIKESVESFFSQQLVSLKYSNDSMLTGIKFKTDRNKKLLTRSEKELKKKSRKTHKSRPRESDGESNCMMKRENNSVKADVTQLVSKGNWGTIPGTPSDNLPQDKFGRNRQIYQDAESNNHKTLSKFDEIKPSDKCDDNIGSSYIPESKVGKIMEKENISAELQFCTKNWIDNSSDVYNEKSTKPYGDAVQIELQESIRHSCITHEYNENTIQKNWVKHTKRFFLLVLLAIYLLVMSKLFEKSLISYACDSGND